MNPAAASAFAVLGPVRPTLRAVAETVVPDMAALEEASGTADASLSADSLEINPYITIMAQSDHLAEGIRTDAQFLARAEGALA